MEERQLLAADIVGATPIDNGEFLLGSVTVTPVFFESDGSIDPDSEQWTETEVNETLFKIRQAVNWWGTMLAAQQSVHTLEFTIDERYARDRVATGYEPITRDSSVFQRYVGDWLTDLGYGDAPSIERAVSLFNDSQRRLHQTDWAFTFFVVDSSDDDDGFFPSGFNGAFAYPGGLFIVIPSTRPASTYAHEMGHIFWARDEYPGGGSWEDTRGYYNAQNLNAADDAPPGSVQVDSIMRGGVVAERAFNNFDTPDSTLAMIGWRDSDGDGIFDLADVPLILDAVGFYDVDHGIYSIRGSAAVDTLPNENSEGTQSDITFNRVRELQYRLGFDIDGEVGIDVYDAWKAVESFEATDVVFDVQVPITTPFDEIQWRAVDTRVGVTSEIMVGDALTPAHSGIGGGFAYLDLNASGQRDAGERLLDGTQFTVRRGDGSELFFQIVDAALLPDDVVDSPGGTTLVSTGDNIDGRVASLPSTTDPSAGKVFQAFDTRRAQWYDTWGEKRELEITAPQSSGRVEIDFVATDTGGYGLESGSYARAVAYDAQGNRIDRLTSDLVLAGQHGKLVLEDSLGRIARVAVFGHADTEILVSAVQFGEQARVSIDDGVFSVDGLPDGDYSVELVSPNLIYQFDQASVDFEIVAGAVAPIAIAAIRVDSPRHNAALPADVNRDQSVTVRDALVVINDLGRLGSRTLTADDTGNFDVDVNNDGKVSAIDALLIINQLERASTGEGESISGQQTQLSQTSDTTGSFRAASFSQSLQSNAVDAAFGPENQDQPWSPNGSSDPDNRQNWQAGEKTTFAKSSADRPSGETALPAGEPSADGAKNTVFGGLSLDFSLDDLGIHGESDGDAPTLEWF